VIHKLTEIEEKECIEVAKIVDGTLVGVDFIPAQDRKKDRPYFIEVNSTPGLIGIEKIHPDSILEKLLTKLKELK
jgi:glutathione synthase/RimK-type ligase-like ATP-grasp enzyme